MSIFTDQAAIKVFRWTYVMAFELLALLGAALLRFFPSGQTLSGNGQPILLVHGYINHSSVWILQKKWLKTLGLGPIYTINLGHPFLSIYEYAERVKIKAEAIARETGRNDLILIGHSMGGLVSSWYATQLAPPNTVTDVITIGSPLLGTPMARLAPGQNGREMEPNSPFIQQLQSAIAKEKQIRFYHIATECDQMVIPGISAVITSHPHLIFDDIGHASLLYSKRVAEQIHRWVISEK